MKIPSVESHVKECVKALGEEYRDLCYMVNSWMDAPSRRVGAAHRVYRHDPVNTPIEACRIYGETVDGAVLTSSRINDVIIFIVTQHLVLDGLLPPTDPIFSLAHRTVMVEPSGTRRIVPFGLTYSLSHEVAFLIRNTIQGLENKLKTLEKAMILCVSAFLFLFLLGVWLSFNIVVLFLILFPIAGILATIDSYTSCKGAYQKLKEQEESGQVECLACKEKTAVLVKKQDSTFIVCKRCGFAWGPYKKVKAVK